MSKISTKRLSRGIRLKVAHVLGQLQTALSQFTTPSINDRNLTNNRSTFRLNFHVPIMRGWALNSNGDKHEHLPIWVPFVLPPTQDFFTGTTTLSPDYPRPVLQEISFSFDQRSEAAAISAFDQDNRLAAHPSSWEGLLNYTAVNRLDVEIALYEKEMMHWVTDEPLIPEDRLFTFTIPAIAYTDTRFRLNPTSKTDLNQAIDPNKSYLLEVSVPGLTDVETPLPPIQLNSVLVSLKFEQRLLPRDQNPPGTDLAANPVIQNMPTSNSGIPTPPTSAITLPTKTPERIMAVQDFTSSGTGIQTAFETLDTLYRKLLRGGYNDRGDAVKNQTILTDAGYEIIAVPMFGNGISLHSDVSTPGKGGHKVPGGLGPHTIPWDVTNNNFTYDMRRIPIRYPMVIHHVIAAVNYTNPMKDREYTVPIDPNYQQIVGVGVGHGLRSDTYGYDQIALANWYGDLNAIGGNLKTLYQIDRYNENLGNLQKNIGFDLLEIPLVGSSGTGFKPQGKPIYVGNTPSENAQRSKLGSSSSLLNRVNQWLEVRWKLEDSANQMTPGGGGSWKDTDTIIGDRGHWVFIIGKKHLV